MQRREFIGGAFAALGMTAFGSQELQKPNLVFGVVSDIHVRQRGWAGKKDDTTYFHKALLWFREQGVDGVAIPGDIADRGRADELEAVAEAWHDVFPKGCGVERLFVSGNHDWWGQGSVAKMDALWTRVWGEKYESIWMKRVKGYAFIGQHWENYQSCLKAPFAKLGPFLKEHGEELGRKKPFFYIQHPHPRNTCYGSWTWGSDAGNVTKALSAFPNAIAFSGHSHYPILDERTIWQGAFTSIGTGSLRYALCNHDEFASEGGYENTITVGGVIEDKLMPPVPTHDMCSAMLVSVYNDHVRIVRRDMFADLGLGPDWVIPLPVAEPKPFAFAERARKSLAPSFPKGAKLSFSRGRVLPRGGRKTDPQVDVLKVTIPAAIQTFDSRVLRYDVRISTVSGKQVLLRRLLSPDFHLPIAKAVKSITLPVDAKSLPEGETIVVKVIPYNSLGKAGAPLTGDVRG